jgi:hypothetical protein
MKLNIFIPLWHISIQLHVTTKISYNITYLTSYGQKTVQK